MWVLCVIAALAVAVSSQPTFINTYRFNSTTCASGSLAFVSSVAAPCTLRAGPCVNGSVTNCEASQPSTLALTVYEFGPGAAQCDTTQAVGFRSYSAGVCFNLEDGRSQSAQCQGNQVRVGTWAVPGCNHYSATTMSQNFTSAVAPRGCYVNSTTNLRTLASSCEGWCWSCSREQGIYVAVFIAVLGTGVLVGLLAMLWGLSKARAARARAEWPSHDEQTPVGVFKSVDVDLLIHGLPHDAD